MSEGPDALHRLAERAGIALRWNDYRNQPHEVGGDTLRRLLSALGVPAETEIQARASLQRLEDEHSGFAPPLVTLRAHEAATVAVGRGADARFALELEDGTRRDLEVERIDEAHVRLAPIAETGYHRLLGPKAPLTLAVAPPHAFAVDARAVARRPWGVAAQLYSLRRAGDGGIGDFTALAQFARHAAMHGADAVAISPAHAQFSADLSRFGPYAPSSRLFLNVLHADADAVFGRHTIARLAAQFGLDSEMRALEAEPLVDWPAAAQVRMKLLRALYEEQGRALFVKSSRRTLAKDLREFRAQGGEALEDHARFEALHAAQLQADPAQWSWRQWDEPLRDPRDAAVATFAAQHVPEVDFHIFLQWLAARSLAAAQEAAKGAGMSIGLIADLAVGTDGGGSHAWSRQREMMTGLTVGAPPDLINTKGQDWGLTAFSPRALAQHGFAPFLETLRAALRSAGGVRIDHVLGLQRLWLVPEGAEATEGAYLRYPLRDLLRLVALESQRHRALVVGEDLGTVPEGFREQLDASGILGMRVLWFENEHDLFIDASRWSRTAMATTSTHDLATVAGWWRGHDLDWRARIGHFDSERFPEARERDIRVRDRQALWAAFQHAGTAPQDRPRPADAESQPVVDAAIDFVSRTPAPLVIVPAEDLLGLQEQPNIPGTLDEHPNWRRRLHGPAETLLDAPETLARTACLRRNRQLPH